MNLNHLDLFSGIGGFSIGLEAAGFKTVAFCEQDEYCKKVLNKHWSGVPIYDDVKRLTGERLRSDGLLWETRGSKDNEILSDSRCERVEKQVEVAANLPGRPGYAKTAQVSPLTGIGILTGGFPCQDLSVAGKQAGITAERSGLWSECARLLGEVRPDYAIFENVTALLSGDNGRWFQRVLFDISEVGYDAEWHCIPAGNSVYPSPGAPHQRDRVWIIAYPNDSGNRPQGHTVDDVADSERGRQPRPRLFVHPGDTSEDRKRESGNVEHVRVRGEWTPEPTVCRMADGVRNGLYEGRVSNKTPNRVHRLKALGNSLIPQIPEAIGMAILKAEGHAR